MSGHCCGTFTCPVCGREDVPACEVVFVSNDVEIWDPCCSQCADDKAKGKS